MKRYLIINSIFIIIILCGIFTDSIFADGNKYLGLTPPGKEPVRFPPDSLLANNDWFYHGIPVFSPDASEMYFSKYNKLAEKVEIWFTQYINGSWSTIQKAPFSIDSYTNNNPVFTYHKDTILFLSGRTNGFIFRVTRKGGVWSQPTPLYLPLPSGYWPGLQFSVAKNGNIYGELENYQNNNLDVYLWRYANGSYNYPEKITAISSPKLDFMPYIDPEERFILFASTRTGGYGSIDIYISRQGAGGTWEAPVNLGANINTDGAFAPSISPDGLYFMFLSQKKNDLGTNPYWMDAKFIYDFLTDVKSDAGKETGFNLNQNFPNPFNPQTDISFSIAESGVYSLKVYNVLGEEMSVLFNKELKQGDHKIKFDASFFPSGVYFYTLTGKDFSMTRKMLLQK